MFATSDGMKAKVVSFPVGCRSVSSLQRQRRANRASLLSSSSLICRSAHGTTRGQYVWFTDRPFDTPSSFVRDSDWPLHAHVVGADGDYRERRRWGARPVTRRTPFATAGARAFLGTQSRFRFHDEGAVSNVRKLAPADDLCLVIAVPHQNVSLSFLHGRTLTCIVPLHQL